MGSLLPGFFRFFRTGEFTTDDTSYGPSSHLSYPDVAVDSSDNPGVVRVTIK